MFILTLLSNYNGDKHELLFKAQHCYKLKIRPLIESIREKITEPDIWGRIDLFQDLMQDLYPFQLLITHDPFTFLTEEFRKFEQAFFTSGQAPFDKIIILTVYLTGSNCPLTTLDWLVNQHPKIVMYFCFFVNQDSRLFLYPTILYKTRPMSDFKLDALKGIHHLSGRMEGKIQEPLLSQYISTIENRIKLNK
jgi:hypothetical protein